MIHKRLYESVPPPPRTSASNKPTLLVSWWCTAFAMTIILVRLSGRKIRTNRLFTEDRVMALSMIPLLGRMALVHVVLLWGTNNTQTEGLTELDIHHREIGSRLVLGSRIFYALFIWTAKLTVSEFLKRLTGRFWRKSFERGLLGIRVFLGATFVAVFIATLAECTPIDHYWQVVPDPGPKCRQGYANLITMGTCDIITDILLVIFPIPIILSSSMTTKMKVNLVLLFSLSLALVGITAYRVPSVISRDGSQQYRSLIASFEILAAAGVSNAIVIGSFIRDRGVKKSKFRVGSITSSLDRTPTRRTTITHHHWGSDADLVSDLGMRLEPYLQSRTNSHPRAPPMATGARHEIDGVSLDSDSDISDDHKTDMKKSASAPGKLDTAIQNSDIPPMPKMTLFDVGGLMENGSPPPPSRQSSSPTTTIHAQDFAFQTPSTGSTSRRGSRAVLSDVGGLLSSHVEEPSFPHPSSSPRPPQQPPPLVRNFSRGGPYSARTGGRHDATAIPLYRGDRDMSGPAQTGSDMMELNDAGGLLSGNGSAR